MARALRVGSVCAGLGTEGFALQDLGVKHVHAFCCEIDKQLRTLLHVNHSPCTTFDDVMKPSFRDAPPVDLLVAGFEWRPFSTDGLNNGTAEARGQIIFHILRYIQRWKPPAVLLENVEGLFKGIRKHC